MMKAANKNQCFKTELRKETLLVGSFISGTTCDFSVSSSIFYINLVFCNEDLLFYRGEIPISLLKLLNSWV